MSGCVLTEAASLTAASVSTPKVQAALDPWEIPKESVVEGLEFWQTGRYGPICKGLLKKRDGASSAVVVKSLRGTAPICQKDGGDPSVLCGVTAQMCEELILFGEKPQYCNHLKSDMFLCYYF